MLRLLSSCFQSNPRRESRSPEQQRWYPILALTYDSRMDIAALFPNGWSNYLVGGIFIGGAVSLLFILTGLIGGMSTVFTSTWSYVSRHSFFQQAKFTGSRVWRLYYAAGLILGTFIWMITLGSPQSPGVGVGFLLVGGFLVGFGARLSNGCTSGHGICGVASWQVPSILAVITFLATAIGTAHIIEALGWMA